MRTVLPLMRQQGSGHGEYVITAGLVGFVGSLYCGTNLPWKVRLKPWLRVECWEQSDFKLNLGHFAQTLTDALWQQPNNPLMPMLR